MVKLPQSVLVFGDGPEAAAIRALWDLFVPQSFRYGIDTLERNVRDLLPADAEDSLIVLVSTKQGEMSVSNLVNRLAFLRFQVQWKGPILLIAAAADVQQVQKGDLFKLQQGARYVAQTCLSRPVSLVELLSALSTLQPYQPGAWRLLIQTLKGQDAIQEAWNLFRQIESEVSNGRRPIDLLKKLFQTLLDETRVIRALIGHNGVDTLRRLGVHEADLSDSVVKCCLKDHPEVVSSLRKIMERIPIGEVIEKCPEEIE